ncbi:MAG: PIG-L family deacetylase [Pirellulaceae bacterium]|nr:PIG-L family deacetylase [Planctomycetales bacterium]
MARTAFAIAAHPDDIEFLMAGTMLHLAERGFELHYMTVANGCCGSTVTDRETTARIRRQESEQAAAAMGAIHHAPLCDDLGIFYEPSTLARLASVVRAVAPEIVLTHAPVDYMEDHVNTCRLAVTAAFARGMPNFSVDPPAAAIADPVALYHAQPYSHRTPLGEVVLPTIWVDTSSVIDRKAELLALHASQKAWLDTSQGQDSYLETLRSLDRELGAWSNAFAYAEGWRQHASIGFGPADWDPLSTALGDLARRKP